MWTIIRCSGMNHREATKSGNRFHSIIQACFPGVGKRTTSATGQFENYPIRGKLCPFLIQTSLFVPSFGLVLYILVFLLGSAGYKLKSVMGSEWVWKCQSLYEPCSKWTSRSSSSHWRVQDWTCLRRLKLNELVAISQSIGPIGWHSWLLLMIDLYK